MMFAMSGEGRLRLGKWCLTAAMAIGVGACQSASGGSSAIQPPTPVTQIAAAKAAGRIASEPVGFAKSRVTIPTGTNIGRWKSGAILGIGCGTVRPSKLAYTGERVLRRRDYVNSFEKAMRAAGVSVAGSSKSLFERGAASAAVFSVGAIIEGLTAELCADVERRRHDLTGLVSGRARIAVQWQVFSELERRVVYTTKKSGFASIPADGVANGQYILVAKAFGDAARRLALDEGFRNIIRKRGPSAGAGGQSGPAAAARPVRIATRAALGSALNPARWKERVAATVTIRVAGGHGSGFFISRSGLVITNQHVVGNASRVSIRLSDGRNIVGRVVARSRARDVALIKAPITNIRPIPVRARRAQIGEAVYAIGTPLGVSLQSTISKGIVSTIRRERNGMTYIQSDVNVQSGSSGGPLIDRYGNAIGISVAGFKRQGLAVGINLFIPIHDAIASLRAGTGN